MVSNFSPNLKKALAVVNSSQYRTTHEYQSANGILCLTTVLYNGMVICFSRYHILLLYTVNNVYFLTNLPSEHFFYHFLSYIYRCG